MNVDYDIYEGREVAGSPRLTLSRGTVVFDDGKILTRRATAASRSAACSPALDVVLSTF